MKKILAVLIACLAITVSAEAKKLYTCTVTVKVTHVYKKNSSTVIEIPMNDRTRTLQVCAEHPSDARRQAEYECDKMCTRGGQNMGTKKYQNEEVYVLEYREIKDITVVAGGDC